MSLSILVDNGEALISFSCTFFEQRLRPDTEVTASSWSSTSLLLPSRNRKYNKIIAIATLLARFDLNGTDSDHEENCESDFEEFSKIASEAPVASEETQSAVKKVLSKPKNLIACP
ncbi:hypothetical protein BpHYR1_012598 [Brachionus plicatilis]|uniref:Uncharacterized protein n=1 Tax=Brachionus plicatilis TaxID=10195 RepID=A0A3M7QHE0_BRAPC|nr:hypothetical protein BpHYR1_012598 [Brachionus plicatilis]